MNAVNYWRKQNLIITNGSLVVGVYNRYCKNVHTVYQKKSKELNFNMEKSELKKMQ